MKIGNISGALRSIYTMLRGISSPEDELIHLHAALNMMYEAASHRFIPPLLLAGRQAVVVTAGATRVTTNTTTSLSPTADNGAAVFGICVNAIGTTSKISFQQQGGGVLFELQTVALGYQTMPFGIGGAQQVVTSGAVAADVTIFSFDYLERNEPTYSNPVA